MNSYTEKFVNFFATKKNMEDKKGQDKNRRIEISEEDIGEEDISAIRISGSQFIGNVGSLEENYDETTVTGDKKELTEVISELIEMLGYLDRLLPNDGTTDRMNKVTEIIKYIEGHPDLKEKILSVLEKFGVQAFKDYLNHPSANLLISAIEDWQ